MSYARVTQNMLSSNMLYNLNKSMTRMDKYQEMFSTGRKVNRPSDDPVSAIRSMMYRTTISENTQFRENTNESRNWLDQTETGINEGVNILHRVKELLTQAINDTYGEEERDKIANEIGKLRDQLGAVANTTYVGEFVFNGEKSNIPPYDEANLDLKDSANISNNDINLEVSLDIKIPINITPERLFGVQGDSVFSQLNQVINDLENNNTAGLKKGLGDIQTRLDKFLECQAEVGARSNRIEMMQNRLDTQKYGNEKMLSEAEDADLAQVITDLQNNENIHRAALAAGSRIIQPTLLDFLR